MLLQIDAQHKVLNSLIEIKVDILKIEKAYGTELYILFSQCAPWE